MLKRMDSFILSRASLWDSVNQNHIPTVSFKLLQEYVENVKMIYDHASKRYDKEGTGGLKNRQKSGRPPELSAVVICQIKQELKESNKGWTTKQVEELIIKKSGIRYHHVHIYRILRKWGFKQKVPRKVHVNTASLEDKNDFKKRSPRYLWTGKINKMKKTDLR